jgi:MFS family permease
MREPVKESIPMSEAQFGLLTTAFLIVYGLLSPVAGYISDILSRKVVIKNGYDGFLTVELGWNYTMEPDLAATKSRHEIESLLREV